MDDLIEHCIRELAFDGDLGSDISRLHDFVREFYATSSQEQVLDDHFYAFIWSLVVQHPTVRVGTKPDGLTTEVYIAPQQSARRKAQAKGEEVEDTLAPELALIDDAICTPLPDLRERYHDDLRIAIHPESVLVAISGTHIRSPKLSPMVYSALQLIARGREEGLSVTALGQTSGYDQKTCFYLVKQLTELDLVVKVRRGGVGSNFCIHKYFYNRSPLWQQILREELDAEDQDPPQEDPNVADEPSQFPSVATYGFTPIDSRHLSSLTLLRSRVTKLLSGSQNNMFPAMNIMFHLGFSNPSHTDRRFFQRRMRELVSTGVVEKVVVPSNTRRSGAGTVVKCYRLVSDEAPAEGNVLKVDDDDDFEGITSGMKMNVTLHKQFTDIIEDSGIKGLTLNEISTSLGDFDKRTIELLLTRAEKYPPPPHLSDLGIKDILETYGRERRYRYLTTAFYEKLMSQQDCGDVSTTQIATSAHGFLQLNDSLFYEDSTHLHEYQDTFKASQSSLMDAADKPKKRSGGTDLKTPPKKRRKTHAEDGSTNLLLAKPTARKRKRGIEEKDMITEIDPTIDSTPAEPKKRGRPPKPKADASNSPPKKRGRPPKKRETVSATVPPTMDTGESKASTSTSTERDASQTAQDLGGTEPPPVTLPSASPVLNSVALRKSSRRQQAKDMVTSYYIPTVSEVDTSMDVNPSSRETGASMERPITTTTCASPISPTGTAQEVGSTPSLAAGSSLVSTALQNEGIEPRACHSSIRKDPRTKSPKVNVSALRREREFLSLLTSAGGIVNTSSKEIYSLHEDVLRSLEAAGEATSTLAGTQIDKRTLRATFADMESRNLVKTIRTAIITSTGLSRPAWIVHKAEVPQHEVDAYLLNLKHSNPTPRPEKITVLNESIAYGAGPANTFAFGAANKLPIESNARITSQDRRARTATQADRLFQQDDDVIRDVLLTERSTVSQLYGYIMGKAKRARKLHLLAISAFNAEKPPQHIVSLDPRIISLSFFHHDIAVEDFCALVAVTAVSPDLGAYISSSEAKKTPLHELPEKLRSDLHLSRARAKSRILELMEVLRLLGLATPLKPSTSTAPYATCTPRGSHPVSYDLATIDENTVPSNAPVYWQLPNLTSLHRWAVSMVSPPFVKDAPLDTISDCAMYWTELQEYCLTEPLPGTVNSIVPADPAENDESSSLGKLLQRGKSWTGDYSLTWYQIRYLQSLNDASSGTTPLQLSNWKSELQRISYVCSAPEAIVSQFFSRTRDKILTATRKASERGPRQKAVAQNKRTGDGAQLRLAQLAADASRQREQDWECLLQTMHPDPVPAPLAAKFGRIRHRFTASAFGKDDPKWSNEIEKTIRETQNIGQQLPRPLRKAAAAAAAAAYPLAIANLPAPAITLNPPVKSVQELITQQKQLLAIQPVQPTLKKKSKKSARRKKEEDGEPRIPNKPATRRTRFQWNRDYEELAQDAYAIVRARCRPHHRVDFTSLEQVFPALPRNSVRQHVVSAKTANGNDAYLQRLEESWYEFWLRYRGTDILPDANPSSISDFDLASHIEVLRNHIDKTALRVGFFQSSLLPRSILPDSPEHLRDSYTIDEPLLAAPCHDFIWNAQKEESREVSLLQQAFVRDKEDLALVQGMVSSEDSVQIAEGALKMVMGTSDDQYSPEAGSSVLADLGNDVVEQATKNLLSKSVLSKLVRDPSVDRPGRQLKINEVNQNALGGCLAQDLFQDASALEFSSSHQADVWRGWPLLSSDGDVVALLQLASEEKVEFMVDVSVSRDARDDLDWNSKKTGDDDLETDIRVRFHDITSPDDVAPNEFLVEKSPALLTEVLPHGFTDTASVACCAREGAELADCTACLHNSTSLLMQTDDGDNEAVASLHAIIYSAGSAGTPASGLDSTVNDSSRIVLRMLTAFPTPLCFWAGYRQQVLVHTAFMKNWTVLVSEDPPIRVQPRRWRDVNGTLVNDVWEAGCRAVVGVVVFRPGLSLTEMRWRLRSVYDRQEVDELVRHLASEGILERRVVADGGDDANTFCFLGGQRSWYHLT